ncbi:MAG: hypothetical protein WEA24_01165 [Gemmatimonadota bacterium]
MNGAVRCGDPRGRIGELTEEPPGQAELAGKSDWEPAKEAHTTACCGDSGA